MTSNDLGCKECGCKSGRFELHDGELELYYSCSHEIDHIVLEMRFIGEEVMN